MPESVEFVKTLPPRLVAEIAECSFYPSLVMETVALGLGEFVYCYYSGTQPSNTGTIVGAVAGFVTGVTVMGSK